MDFKYHDLGCGSFELLKGLSLDHWRTKVHKNKKAKKEIVQMCSVICILGAKLVSLRKYSVKS